MSEDITVSLSVFLNEIGVTEQRDIQVKEVSDIGRNGKPIIDVVFDEHGEPNF